MKIRLSYRIGPLAECTFMCYPTHRLTARYFADEQTLFQVWGQLEKLAYRYQARHWEASA